MSMTSYERMFCTLHRQPVDQIPIAVSPWGETIERWKSEGHLQADENAATNFGQDFTAGGWLNSVVDLDFTPQTLEETEETILSLDGNGAILRQHKLHASTPEHVDFTIKDRESWEAKAKPLLAKIDRRRIGFEGYRKEKERAVKEELFFLWAGVAPFEQMHPLCGHENMLMGMALDPEWVQDMVQNYVDLTINHLELLFAEEGKPDGMFFYEDMGFKFRPFMSPEMYRDIMQPGHKRLFDYSHDLGCKVIVHSCGYIEPLVPGLIEAGMDCLQAMEVKAGMDLPTLFAKFGSKIAFFGGLDVRVLINNDRDAIEEELQKKLVPVLQGGGSYILHSDHSEPPEVNFETMKFFVERGREISREIFAQR